MKRATIVFLMYVDESGDDGVTNDSPTRYYALVGIVIHETKWSDCLQKLINFRVKIKNKYGIGVRDEIHTYYFLQKPKQYSTIAKHVRLSILKSYLDELSLMTEISIINIIIDKQKSKNSNIFDVAWNLLIQRFENTMKYNNFPDSDPTRKESGIIFTDNINIGKNAALRTLSRRMRRYNPIPHKRGFNAQTLYNNQKLELIIEDPNFRESHHSYFIQSADVCSFFLRQAYNPNRYMKQKGRKSYFYRLQPVFCIHASKKNKYGIVEL